MSCLCTEQDALGAESSLRWAPEDRVQLLQSMVRCNGDWNRIMESKGLEHKNTNESVLEMLHFDTEDIHLEPLHGMLQAQSEKHSTRNLINHTIDRQYRQTDNVHSSSVLNLLLGITDAYGLGVQLDPVLQVSLFAPCCFAFCLYLLTPFLLNGKLDRLNSGDANATKSTGGASSHSKPSYPATCIQVHHKGGSPVHC